MASHTWHQLHQVLAGEKPIERGADVCYDDMCHFRNLYRGFLAIHTNSQPPSLQVLPPNSTTKDRKCSEPRAYALGTSRLVFLSWYSRLESVTAVHIASCLTKWCKESGGGLNYLGLCLWVRGWEKLCLVVTGDWNELRISTRPWDRLHT